MRRYAIVGSGVAGITAAEAIRGQDAGGEIALISDDPHGYYSRPGLAYLLSGEISEDCLYPNLPEHGRPLGLSRRQARVSAVDPPSHRLTLSNGEVLSYDRLLLATGATANGLRVAGAELEGVVKLDHLEDAQGILGLARKGRGAVVVGGGITALELVEGLAARGVKVHYFLRGERYWGNVLDEAESRIVEDRLREHGVVLHFQTEAAEITGQRGKVTGVRTRVGQLVPCQIIAVAIGIHPRLELAQNSGIRVERGILVDEHLRTSAEDIFAAGDAAQMVDRRTGQSQLDSLWGTARQQGAVAGLNMSGAQAVYQKKPALNITRLAGLTTTIIGMVGSGRDADLAGIARGDSESWRQASDAIAVQEGAPPNRLRLLVGQHAITGAVVMGNQAYSEPLEELVTRGADIRQVRDRLLKPGAPLGGLVVEFWHKWKEEHAPQ